MKDKKVLVSGCFDLLHGGHVAFLKAAAQYGKLFVAVGADENLFLLKGNKPYFSQDERVYIINSIRFVEKAFVSSGSGMLDFEPDLKTLKPDVFVVNSDGHTIGKKTLCEKLGVEYKVLERVPEDGLPPRASSSIKKELQFPYRLCIAGGWLDQPWVSEKYPGSCIVAQLYPTIKFNDRSGMATSSRKVAIDLWGGKYPNGDSIKNAKLLFGAENPPGSKYISGSQDQIGLLNPGINRLVYNGNYWPKKIESITDQDTCEWLSSVLHLVPLSPRPNGYDPLKKKNISLGVVKKLSKASELCWKSIIKKDAAGLGKSLTETFYAWKEMLPYTVPESVMKIVEKKILPNYLGALPSGSGGGYIIVVSKEEIPGAVKIKIRF
jgi:cytidyltransferase-like protein